MTDEKDSGVAKGMRDILSKKDVPTKCKFCGDDLTALCYPRRLRSNCVNSVCRNSKCRARYHGRSPDKLKWYTGEEWKEWINA